MFEVAWDHPRHGPHTLLSHDDQRYQGCRAGECEPLYRRGVVAPGVWWCPSFEQVTTLDRCSACGPVVAPHRRLLIDGGGR